ncbi:MAG TPA: phosphotransferase [Clostridiaceae bacterium]
MEKEIKELMNDGILDTAAKRFGLKLTDLSYIGGFQNFVYEYLKEDRWYILRITHSSHRSENNLLGELDFINYIHSNGVSVSRPIISVFGKLTEIIEIADSYFIVTSFEKAEGKKIHYPECMNNDSLSEMCGEITGQIHALSLNYLPQSIEKTRHDWTENNYLKNITRFIPSTQHKIFEQYELLQNQINGLKKERNYGIIHGDINVGNFLINGEKLTLFDFDECQYSWFIEDIAIQLFYMVYVVLDDSIGERNFQAQRFIQCFLKGYKRHFSIDEDSLKSIPLFLKLRELIVYIGMYRSFNLANLDEWTAIYINESRRRIETGLPIVAEIFD